MKKYLSIIIVCTIGLLYSCDKEIELVAPASTTEGLAFIKIVHASPNFRQVFRGADSFNIYVNGIKINGAQFTYNFMFPTSLYAGVPAGPQSIRITVNGRMTPDSITLASLSKTLIAGNYYSFIITDEALSTNESRQMWLRDDVKLVDTIKFSLRFVHAVLNDPGAVDVYSTRQGANIFTNISPATATPFSVLNYTLQSDTLIVKSTGTQTEIARINGAVFNRTRSYTLLYRGQFGITGAKGRGITIYINN